MLTYFEYIFKIIIYSAKNNIFIYANKKITNGDQEEKWWQMVKIIFYG